MCSIFMSRHRRVGDRSGYKTFHDGLLSVGFLSFVASLSIVTAVGQSPAPVGLTSAQTTEKDAVRAVISPLDNTVFSPESTAALGQRDIAAATELTAYVSVLGGGSHWVGMQGIGTMTYATDPTQYTVTLTNQGTGRFRLDTQTPAGIESIRIQGRSGKVQLGNKPALAMNPDTAILGLFPFEIVGRAAPEAANTALLDRGNATSNGQSLHRVTLELPSTTRNFATKWPGTLPIDLYFDPATHLLAKSVCYIFIPGGREIPFLSVVMYSDYRRIGVSMVPFHYAETINGRPYRTLQLSSVQLKPTLSADYFKF